MKYKLTTCTLLFVSFLVYSLQTVNNNLKKELVKAINHNYAYVASDSLVGHDYIIFKTEVSNLNYREFLLDLKQRGEVEKWRIANIDSTRWSTEKWTNNAYVEHYHKHPAYNDYPVVNVSKEGAELYCEWLTEKVNATLKDSYKLEFRLPTQQEWIKAAKGKLQLSNYSWGGYRLQNSEGSYMCNCLAFGSECISRDSTGKYIVQKVDYSQFIAGNDYADITAPVKSYWPNGYGLYNMNGNVAEMVSDKNVVVGGSWNDPGYDVRNESEKPYNGAARTVGFRVVATVDPSRLEWLKLPKK